MDYPITSSSSVENCSSCGSTFTSTKARLGHLEDAVWNYEKMKGVGSFQTDHQDVHNTINTLQHKVAELHAKHAQHIVDALKEV
jgi:hypothetical protein